MGHTDLLRTISPIYDKLLSVTLNQLPIYGKAKTRIRLADPYLHCADSSCLHMQRQRMLFWRQFTYMLSYQKHAYTYLFGLPNIDETGQNCHDEMRFCWAVVLACN